jgi:hypothetical protein
MASTPADRAASTRSSAVPSTRSSAETGNSTGHQEARAVLWRSGAGPPRRGGSTTGRAGSLHLRRPPHPLLSRPHPLVPRRAGRCRIAAPQLLLAQPLLSLPVSAREGGGPLPIQFLRCCLLSHEVDVTGSARLTPLFQSLRPGLHGRSPSSMAGTVPRSMTWETSLLVVAFFGYFSADMDRSPLLFCRSERVTFWSAARGQVFLHFFVDANRPGGHKG